MLFGGREETAVLARRSVYNCLPIAGSVFNMLRANVEFNPWTNLFRSR